MKSDVPRMLAAVRKGRAAEEGCHLERELVAALAQRDEKDKQLASCYDRMDKAEAQRDKALVILRYYRHETPLGHQPYMLAHEVDLLLKECGK
tara:strand:- start:229 stop:507 length:279 start_codon:yes stop_codon:yes gene_type:complete